MRELRFDNSAERYLRILEAVSNRAPEQWTMLTHNCNFATKLVLDLALFDGIGCLIFDDGEEVLDTHVGDSPQNLLLVENRCATMVYLKVGVKCAD